MGMMIWGEFLRKMVPGRTRNSKPGRDPRWRSIVESSSLLDFVGISVGSGRRGGF